MSGSSAHPYLPTGRLVHSQLCSPCGHRPAAIGRALHAGCPGVTPPLPPVFHKGNSLWSQGCLRWEVTGHFLHKLEFGTEVAAVLHELSSLLCALCCPALRPRRVALRQGLGVFGRSYCSLPLLASRTGVSTAKIKGKGSEFEPFQS